MKKKKNSTFYKYTRKQILVLSVLVIFGLSLVSILARYVMNYANDFYTRAQEFYFYSDKLKENNPTYRIEQWTGVNTYTIPIKLSTAKNSLEKATYDINYSITYSCSSNVTCQINKTTGIIYATSNEDYITLQITPNTSLSTGDVAEVNITATSSSPYQKSIMAKFILVVGDSAYTYKIEDSVGQIYCDLIITNTTNYYLVQTAFGPYSVGDRINIYTYYELTAEERENCVPTKIVRFDYDPQILSLDMANTTVELFSMGTETQGTTEYVVSYKVGVGAESSARVRFYKADSTQDYTYPIVNNTSVIEVELLDW